MKIKKRMEKAKYMAHEVRRMGNGESVGNADVSVRFLLLETLVKPSLLANVETWSNISKKEEKMITKTHYEVLRIVFEQKRNTPYLGIIAETGIWPYKHVIVYKKLMYLHHLIHSDNQRITRKLLINQSIQTNKKNWYNELKTKANKMKIEIEVNKIENETKSEWKKKIKEKIEVYINKEIQEAANLQTKLRFIRGKQFKKEEYLEVGNTIQCSKVMQIRLNMIDAKRNYRNRYKEDLKCIGCNMVEETTEHLVKCDKYKELASHSIILDEGGNNMKQTEWLLEATHVFDRIGKVRERLKKY